MEDDNMQKCKYLDDLGLKIEDYGTNFTSDDDTRQDQWSQQRKKYGFDERETWNLDTTFIEWIYTRVMMYKKCSPVNMEYHRISYKNETITQGDAIDKILDLAKQILLNQENDALRCENSREICDLWKEVLPYMWW